MHRTHKYSPLEPIHIMRTLLVTLAIAASLAYPLIVYFGIQHTSPAVFAVVLGSVTIAKFISRQQENRYEFWLLIIGLLFSALLAISNSEYLLRLYPVIISLLASATFAFSLWQPTSLIERISIKLGKHITPNAKFYTRRLSALWAVLLLLNALAALYFALTASLSTWALYCGVVSYCIFGIVAIIEYIYRCYFIRRYGA